MQALAPGWEMEVDRGPGWLLVHLKSTGRDASDTPPLADELWDRPSHPTEGMPVGVGNPRQDRSVAVSRATCRSR